MIGTECPYLCCYLSEAEDFFGCAAEKLPIESPPLSRTTEELGKDPGRTVGIGKATSLDGHRPTESVHSLGPPLG